MDFLQEKCWGTGWFCAYMVISKAMFCGTVTATAPSNHPGMLVKASKPVESC